MKIKTKLFLNVAIVAGISVTISATSYVGMTFIKEKLSFLTEKSTPFQIRTLELQRASQGAAADLIKVSVARTKTEFAASKTEADKSLVAVKKIQDTLEGMSSEKYTVHADLVNSYETLAKTIEKSLTSDEETAKAAKLVDQQLHDAINNLKDLDSRVKALQLTSSATYETSVDDRNSMADKSTSLAMAKTQLRDIMVVVLQSQRGNAKRYRSQSKALLESVQQNNNVRGNPKIREEVKSLVAKTEEYFAAKIGGDTAKADSLINELQEKLDALITLIDTDLEKVNEKIADATGKQGTNFTQSSIAVNALSTNAELVASGLALDGMVTRLFNAATPKEVDSILTQINTQYGKISKSAADLERNLNKVKAKKELSYLKKAAAGLAAIHTSVTAPQGTASKVKQALDSRELATAESRKLREIVLKLAEKGKQTEVTAQGEQEKSIAAVNSMIRKSLGLILTIGTLAVAFGIIFGFWMYRGIAHPLSRLIATAREIASGNLNCSLSLDSNDEIGQVQEEMASMVGSLQSIAKKIGVATDTLAGSSEELSSTARTLEQSTEEQTGRIEQSAVAMTEMSQTINDVSDNANATATTAASMRETANHGRDKMHTAVNELHRFAETIKCSAREVETLGTQSEKITGIVALINDIADQTNLLALNAAIEAARAGEQGRGFAVVADEVRKLAARTAEATDEIVGNVSSMNTGVDTAVKLIREESSSVDRVVNIVNESVQSIDEIVENMDKITDMVGRIAVAAQQQSATSDDISRVMNTISDVAKQIKSAFVDVKQSSENLATTASDLNDTAKWFRL
jgi:methyl-accepting chemotaxis protein